MSHSTAPNYDSKCEELAIAFLADQPHYTLQDMRDLADRIQETIEDFLAERFPERFP